VSVRGLGGVRLGGCAPNVSTALSPGIAHLHGSHAHCRFEKLFRAPGSEQAASIKFLLFVKDKLSFGTDPETDEWISAQATLAMENFNPRWQGRGSAPEVIEMIRWRGFEFASSVYVTHLAPSFRSSSFVDAPEQDRAALSRRACVIRPEGQLLHGSYRA